MSQLGPFQQKKKLLTPSTVLIFKINYKIKYWYLYQNLVVKVIN